MEMPLNARVECSDGVCGRSVYVLINPVFEEVTHVVVKEDSFPNTEYIVPVDIVAETIAETIQLRCSRVELEKIEPFRRTDYVEEKIPYRHYGYGAVMYPGGSLFYMPYVTPEESTQVPIEHLQIPPGELAVARGARVEAMDGYIGKVDEFVINPDNGHITSLVLREGHLWGQRDVIIPLSAIGETSQDTVQIKLNKRQIGALPTFRLQRRWS